MELVSQPPKGLSPPARPRAPAMGMGAKDVPHPVLPGEHFAAALLFFITGALGLAWIAPDLAHGAFFLPRVVAVVHLFALGWIVLSIFGALCQFLPVAIGRPLRFQGLAHANFAVHIVAVASFVTALSIGHRPLLLLGASLLALSLLGFAANLTATLFSAKERDVTFWALAGAALFLAITPVYGLLLALNLHGYVQLADRFSMVAVHAHIAIVGFVMLVVVGVAHRLLPMFLLSHGASERPAQVSVFLLFAASSLLALPLPFGAARMIAAGILAGLGVIAFLVQAYLFFKERKRKAVDPGMKLAASGLLGVASALVLSPIALSQGMANPKLLVAYFVALLGGLSMFVAGHYYKIVPFLVWYHRFGPLVGKRKVPKVAELYSERAVFINGVLLVLGWVGLAGAAYLGAGQALRISALVLSIGTVLLGILIARIAQRRAV